MQCCAVWRMLNGIVSASWYKSARSQQREGERGEGDRSGWRVAKVGVKVLAWVHKERMAAVDKARARALQTEYPGGGVTVAERRRQCARKVADIENNRVVVVVVVVVARIDKCRAKIQEREG